MENMRTVGEAAPDEELTPTDVEIRDQSFEERMRARRLQREQRTTESFDVPGFEDLFRVEMQVIGYKRLADVALRHARVRDEALRTLYIAADQILMATVGFHRVKDEGGYEQADGDTWLSLARSFDNTIDATLRPRAALIRLLEGAGVIALNNDWYEWNTRGNQTVDKELAGDF